MKKTNESSREFSLTIIAAGMEVAGELSSSDDIRIDGKFFGELETTGRIVITGEGYVEGNVRGKDITIDGNAKGEFRAEKNFQLSPKGVFKGTVETRFINITETAVFDGTCVISQTKKFGPLKRLVDEFRSGKPVGLLSGVGSGSSKDSSVKPKASNEKEKEGAAGREPQKDTDKESEADNQSKGKSLISSKISQIESL